MRLVSIAAVLACLATFALSACTDPHAAPAVDPLDCVACHQSQFDAVPAHANEGASISCWTCHGTTGWYPIVPRIGSDPRRHSWFRIERGSHAGYDCWQCHLETTPEDPYDDPAPNAVSCTGCHSHTAGRTDPLHLGNGDYSYEPKSCLRCHRRGGGGD